MYNSINNVNNNVIDNSLFRKCTRSTVSGRRSYRPTSQQRPPWCRRKSGRCREVTVMGGGGGGRGVIRQILIKEYNIFIVLCSCLLCPKMLHYFFFCYVYAYCIPWCYTPSVRMLFFRPMLNILIFLLHDLRLKILFVLFLNYSLWHFRLIMFGSVNYS